MQIVGRKNILHQYHIGNYVFEDLIEHGMPVHMEEMPHGRFSALVCDTDEVDAWLKEQGINLVKKTGRSRDVQKYITVDQAKRMFPHNPAMALLYAIFCTKDDYVKHFRNVKVDE